MKQVVIAEKEHGFTVTVVEVPTQGSYPQPNNSPKEAAFSRIEEAVKHAYDALGGPPIENQAQDGEAVEQLTEARVGHSPYHDEWERIQRRTRAVDMATHIAAHSPGTDGTATSPIEVINAAKRFQQFIETGE